MPRLRWEDVAAVFEVDGALRDVYVRGTTAEDWQRLVDFVRRRGWRYEYSQESVPRRVPAVSTIFAHPESSYLLAFWPSPGIAVHAHFFVADEIELDVDPREVQGQERLDQLVSFLRALGREMGREVVLTLEGFDEALLAYDPATGEVTARP